jgi:hypothetical protein
LECDTSTEPCRINLFEVEALQRKWNVELYITDISNNAGTNNITIVAGGTDVIDVDGTTSLVLNENGASVVLQPMAEKKWIAIESVSGGVAPPTPSYIEYNALLTQGGAEVPPSVVTNGVDGITGVWSYVSLGTYHYTKAGAFAVPDKVEITMQNVETLAFTMSNAAFNTYSAKVISDDVIEVRTAQWTTKVAGTTLVVAPIGTAVETSMIDGIMDRVPFNVKVWS